MAALEKITNPRLRGALANRRETLNALFEARRRSTPGLSADEVHAAVATLFPAIVDAVIEQGEACINVVVESLFRAVLVLLPAGHVGDRSVVHQVWTQILPVAAPLLGRDPDLVIALLSNAALALDAESPEIMKLWIQNMRTVTPLLLSVDDIRRAGIALAWRSGRAEWREEGLTALRALPLGAAGLALGLDAQSAVTDVRREIDDLAAHPWADFAGKEGVKVAAIVGGWSGINGPFRERPTVIQDEKKIYALSGNDTWQIFADRFGARLVPCDRLPPRAPTMTYRSFFVDEHGTVCGESANAFLGSAGVRTCAFVNDTLVVSLERSYCVVILGRNSPHVQ